MNKRNTMSRRNTTSRRNPQPMNRKRTGTFGVSFPLNNNIPPRLPVSNKNKRVSFKDLQNGKNSASKPRENSRTNSQKSMTQKNRGSNPLIDELKFNFTDPLKINTNLVKIKNDVLSDYIHYLVELKTMSQTPKSIFTSKTKISDVIDSIDKKLGQLQKIKDGDLQRENRGPF